MNDRIKQGVKKGGNDINLWPRKVEIDVERTKKKRWVREFVYIYQVRYRYLIRPGGSEFKLCMGWWGKRRGPGLSCRSNTNTEQIPCITLRRFHNIMNTLSYGTIGVSYFPTKQPPKETTHIPNKPEQGEERRENRGITRIKDPVIHL